LSVHEYTIRCCKGIEEAKQDRWNVDIESYNVSTSACQQACHWLHMQGTKQNCSSSVHNSFCSLNQTVSKSLSSHLRCERWKIAIIASTTPLNHISVLQFPSHASVMSKLVDSNIADIMASASIVSSAAEIRFSQLLVQYLWMPNWTPVHVQLYGWMLDQKYLNAFGRSSLHLNQIQMQNLPQHEQK
jgi:hypothetical protein